MKTSAVKTLGSDNQWCRKEIISHLHSFPPKRGQIPAAPPVSDPEDYSETMPLCFRLTEWECFLRSLHETYC